MDRRSSRTPIVPWWRPLSHVGGLLVAGGLFFGVLSPDSKASDAPAPETNASPAGASVSGAVDVGAIGRAAFFDRSLSEPAGTSCASCHDPARGYAGANGSFIGVAQGSRPGHFAKRTTPSVLYLSFVRRFHFHWEEDAPLPDAFGGFFWDGRVDSLAALTRQPLLNPDEMGNRDVADVARKIDVSAYGADLHRALGGGESADATVLALGKAIEAFLTSAEMSPFTSKFDDVVRGQAAFTPLEAKGLALFKDPSKGACSACHLVDETASDPARSPFSDYGFESVGVPRNGAIPTNRDPKFADLGLCERAGAALPTSEDRWCGSFRTPSLRNVATRPSFMHNGAFTSLRDVVAFYATRSTTPKRWYPRARYDDLPVKYREYVNDLVPPYDRTEGEAPALDDAEIDAVVAFLQTLTDAQYR